MEYDRSDWEGRGETNNENRRAGGQPSQVGRKAYRDGGERRASAPSRRAAANGSRERSRQPRAGQQVRASQQPHAGQRTRGGQQLRTGQQPNSGQRPRTGRLQPQGSGAAAMPPNRVPSRPARRAGVSNQYSRDNWKAVRQAQAGAAQDAGASRAAASGRNASRTGEPFPRGTARQDRNGKKRRAPAFFRSEAPKWFAQSPLSTKVLGGVAEAKRWNAFRVIVAIIVALLAVYLGGVAHYSTYFYPSSTIGPVDVSGMNVDTAAGALERSATDYKLTVTGNNVSFTLKGKQAGLELDTQVIAQNAFNENNGWAWPVALLFPHDYSDALSASTDSDKLEQKVKEEVDAYNATATAPVNATISYNKSTGGFQIAAEQDGNTLDEDAVAKDVANAISQLSSTLTLTDSDYKKPTVTSDNANLVQARKNAATVLSTDLKLQIKGTTVTELLGTTAAQWVTTDGDGNLALDSDKVQAWCSKVAKKYTTVGSKRTFTRADGEKITVSGGSYGWDVDEDSLVTTVHDDVLKGDQETLDLPMSQTADAYNADTGVDWTSYIDVDISEQHATYYDANGKVLWESDVVTGAPGGDTDTSTGVYYINNKESPSTLNGYNLQTGKKKYSTKVKYWMPWDGNVIGFHDATWQSAFGGTRYKDGYGSNGCVNLPLKKAASLYKLVKVGTVVVSHK
ncbi:MAG: L,D-transpeptidase family protein [Eggerthellaceae bacterium]|jgi:hypothetical protein